MDATSPRRRVPAEEPLDSGCRPVQENARPRATVQDTERGHTSRDCWAGNARKYRRPRIPRAIPQCLRGLAVSVPRDEGDPEPGRIRQRTGRSGGILRARKPAGQTYAGEILGLSDPHIQYEVLEMQSEARIAELGTSATGLDVTALLVVHGATP